MNLEERVHRYKELQRQIQELEETKKALVAEILTLMPQDVFRCDAFRVQRISRLSIKTSIEDARPYGAVKMEEVVDKDLLKELFERGERVPDISKIQFIQVYQTQGQKSPK